MNEADPVAVLRRENDHLANAVASLEARLPTPEDIAWLHSKRVEAERAAWAWQQIKKYAPWVGIAASMLGAAITWLATHTINIGAKP